MPDRTSPAFPYSSSLSTPVIGMEAEFRLFLDGKETVPESIWKTPADFIDHTLLPRASKSYQLPTGGAVYFDGDVLEVVTPGIEIQAECTARVVRNLWEQIGFVRDQLTLWGERNGPHIRLQAFGCHYNVSFELPRGERNKDRTIQKLAVLLAQVLPVPVIILGANRRSTGVGVRPRRNRIEITFDFTPDPGLMVATAAVIVGIVRGAMDWPSYRLETLEAAGVPILKDVNPGRHTTRKGWLTKDFHFPRSPFTTSPDEESWETMTGERMSLREMARKTAWAFRDSILRYSDPFTSRLLFAVLTAEVPSMLDLGERPRSYDDVGRGVRWGIVIPELENYRGLIEGVFAVGEKDDGGRIKKKAAGNAGLRRAQDLEESLAPPWSGEESDRRGLRSRAGPDERSGKDRRSIKLRKRLRPSLNRSNYEKVFLRLASGKKLRIGGETLTPVAMKGWYHAVFRRASDGKEETISIDQLARNMERWSE